MPTEGERLIAADLDEPLDDYDRLIVDLTLTLVNVQTDMPKSVIERNLWDLIEQVQELRYENIDL